MPEFGMPEWIDGFVGAAGESGVLGKAKGLMLDTVGTSFNLEVGVNIPAEPKIGMLSDLNLLIKIENSALAGMKVPTEEELAKASLAVTLPYDQAKQMFQDVASGKLGIADMMPMVMSGKIKIKGNIAPLMKYAGAMPKMMPLMPEMLGIMGKVETIWPDELPPDKLEAYKERAKKEMAPERMQENLAKYGAVMKELWEKA